MYYPSSLLTRSVARSALQARIPRDYLSDRLGEARTQYFLWSCLTDAVRSDAVASRKIRGIFTSKTHFKVRCRSEEDHSTTTAFSANISPGKSL